MCGIAGFVNWDGQPASAFLLQAMTDRLAHRGPDGEGHHVWCHAALGHRRLAIIDVGSGAQPMANEDDSVWVTFNGEIYNFLELRQLLEGHGHVFATRSDTEVIVHGYEQWGEEVVPRLRGIFAFAILDQRRGRLLLARDHLGVKPLVYYADRHRIFFASEMKAITVNPSVPREIDPEAISDYFEYGYVPAPKTVLKGFRKLEPGCLISLDVHRSSPVAPRRYWQLDFLAEQLPDNRKTLDLLDEQLDEAVRLELVSDVPLGSFLSGGLDSSLVSALMARHSADRIRTFSAGFDEARFSETEYARKVARHLNTEHHEHVVRPDIAALLPKLVYHFDEPFSDASAVPTYYVCEMARRNVTVCLSGDGGDEMFAGYDRYRHLQGQARMDWLPQSFRETLFGRLATVYPEGWPLAELVAGVPLSSAQRFGRHMSRQYGLLQASDLLSECIRASLPAGRRPFDHLVDAFDPRIADPLQAMLDVDVRTYLPNDILTKVDITSMMNSLEVRVPLLDYKLAEFAARLPPSLKIRGREGKYALKEVGRRYLPDEIVSRRKMGFGVPMREWLASELRDFTDQYLLHTSRSSGLLDTRVVQDMVADNASRLYQSRSSGKLWWALFFEIWHRDVYSVPAAQVDTRGARSARADGERGSVS